MRLLREARAYFTSEDWVWMWLTLAAAMASYVMLGLALLGVVSGTAAGLVGLVALLFAAGLVTRGTGASPATSAELDRLREGTIWHVTSRELAVGDLAELDPAHCRLTSRLSRLDRLFARPQRAVWFFRSQPSAAHISGNVGRRRARFLYELQPHELEQAFVRRDAIASTSPVVAAVVSATRV